MMKTKDNAIAKSTNHRGPYIPLNVTEHNDSIQMDFLLPGYRQEEIEIAISDGYLNLSAKIDAAEVKYLRKEFNKQDFKRQFKLPSKIDIDSITANMRNGILSLSIKKIQPRKIHINIK